MSDLRARVHWLDAQRLSLIRAGKTGLEMGCQDTHKVAQTTWS